MSTREEAYRRRRARSEELVSAALDALQHAAARSTANPTAPSLLLTALNALTLAKDASRAVDEEFGELERVLKAACDAAQPQPTLQDLTAKQAASRKALRVASTAVLPVRNALGLP